MTSKPHCLRSCVFFTIARTLDASCAVGRVSPEGSIGSQLVCQTPAAKGKRMRWSWAKGPGRQLPLPGELERLFQIMALQPLRVYLLVKLRSRGAVRRSAVFGCEAERCVWLPLSASR